MSALAAMHATSVTHMRLNARYSGFYASAEAAKRMLAPGAYRRLATRRNGTVILADEWRSPSGTRPFGFLVHRMVSLAAGDYVELCAEHDTGGNLNIEAVAGQEQSPEFWMQRIGD